MKTTPTTSPCPVMEAAFRVSSMIQCNKKSADQIIERLAAGDVCIVRRRQDGNAVAMVAGSHTPWRAALKELEIT